MWNDVVFRNWRNKLFASEGEKNDITMEQIEKRIQELIKKFEEVNKYVESLSLSTNDNIILVIGNTKNGKSTILNILNKTRLVIKEHKDEIPKYTVEKENENDINFKISSETHKSGTKLPSVMRVQKNIYVDTPGFMDSTYDDRIINKYFINRILSKSSTCKIMLVLSETDFTSVAGKQIRDQLSLVETTIYEDQLRKRSLKDNNLLIVINKCSGGASNTSYKNKLIATLKETANEKDQNFIQIIERTRIETIPEAKPKKKWFFWKNFEFNGEIIRKQLEKAIDEIQFLSIANSFIFKGDEGRDIKDCFNFIQEKINYNFSEWQKNFLNNQLSQLKEIPAEKVTNLLTNLFSTNYLLEFAQFLGELDPKGANLVKEIDNIIKNYGSFFNGIKYYDGNFNPKPQRLDLNILDIKEKIHTELCNLFKIIINENKNREEINKAIKDKYEHELEKLRRSHMELEAENTKMRENYQSQTQATNFKEDIETINGVMDLACKLSSLGGFDILKKILSVFF